MIYLLINHNIVLYVFILLLQRVQHFNKFIITFDFFLAWTKIFQWLSGFVTFTLEMKQFHLFICFRFLCIFSHQTTVTERLYFIVDTYVKSRKNLDHQYWPDQSRSIREKICMGRVVLSVSQRQFSSYLCKYNSS